MKFAPKSAKRIKKVNNGIKISRIIGKWANAHNKHRKYTQKWHYNPIFATFILFGLLEEAHQRIMRWHFPLFFHLILSLGVW